VTNHYGLPGLKENALTMKSLGDAMRLRNHLIAHLEEADSDCCKLKRPLLAFVVAGGGFAGVETIAGIKRFRPRCAAILPQADPRHASDRPCTFWPGHLARIGQKLGAYAQRKLMDRKVEVRLKTKVEGFSGGGGPA